MSEHEEEEEELPGRGRIRRYKDEETMRKECHNRVMLRRRLTLLQGMWLYNRYENAGYSLQGLETAHHFTLYELEQARATIKALRQRIQELEGTQE